MNNILNQIGIENYIFLCVILFCIGIFGVLYRRNAIIVFMSIEIMLNAVNLLFVAFSTYHQDAQGQVFVFFSMAVAAAEVAVGLAILVSIFRNHTIFNDIFSFFFSFSFYINQKQFIYISVIILLKIIKTLKTAFLLTENDNCFQLKLVILPTSISLPLLLINYLNFEILLISMFLLLRFHLFFYKFHFHEVSRF
jgi:NADH-quinone oxidoreductase subunit K